MMSRWTEAKLAISMIKRGECMKLPIKYTCPYCGLETEEQIEVYPGGLCRRDVTLIIQCPRCQRQSKETLFYEHIERYDSTRRAILLLYNRYSAQAHLAREGYPIPCMRASRRLTVSEQLGKIEDELHEAMEAYAQGKVDEALEELADVQIAAATGQQMLGANFRRRRDVMERANFKNYGRGYWEEDRHGRF